MSHWIMLYWKCRYFNVVECRRWKRGKTVPLRSWSMGVKDFVTTAIKPVLKSMTMEGGVDKIFPKLRDVIYGRPLCSNFSNLQYESFFYLDINLWGRGSWSGLIFPNQPRQRPWVWTQILFWQISGEPKTAKKVYARTFTKLVVRKSSFMNSEFTENGGPFIHDL